MHVMDLTKMDLKFETIPFVIYACLGLHNICQKNDLYIGEELVKSQTESIKDNEEKYYNISLLVFPYDWDKGQIARSILVSFIYEFVWKNKDKSTIQSQQS